MEWVTECVAKHSKEGPCGSVQSKSDSWKWLEKCCVLRNEKSKNKEKRVNVLQMRLQGKNEIQRRFEEFQKECIRHKDTCRDGTARVKELNTAPSAQCLRKVSADSTVELRKQVSQLCQK